MQKTPDRLRKHLSHYAKKYPGAWKDFDKFHKARGKDLPDWPSWCWCPLSASYAIVGKRFKDSRVPWEDILDVGVLGALAAWRMTQSIFRFDPDLFFALWDTPLTGKLPKELLYRLPEWCVYIEAPPGHKMGRGLLLGWFAFLEWDVQTGRTELRFVFDLDTGLIPFVIHLTEKTLSQCIEKALEESNKQAELVGKEQFAENEDTIKTVAASLAPLFSVTLYLCSVSSDISDLQGKREKPGNPKPLKTKKGLRIFPADRQTTWLVGHRVGAALRRGNIGAGGGASEPEGHAGKRPHIRRAHWHSFWVGPKKEPKRRRLIVKWLHPILIGGGEIVPTIRLVE